MIVERMKQPQMQPAPLDAQHDATLGRPFPVIERYRPPCAVRHHRHPVRPQQMQFPRLARFDKFEIGVARHQKMAVERFTKARPGAAPVRL